MTSSGIVDPTLNAPCITANIVPSEYNIADAFIPVQGFTDPSQCADSSHRNEFSRN